jgi:hypothetical protein
MVDNIRLLIRNHELIVRIRLLNYLKKNLRITFGVVNQNHRSGAEMMCFILTERK